VDKTAIQALVLVGASVGVPAVLAGIVTYALSRKRTAAIVAGVIAAVAVFFALRWVAAQFNFD
jgi:branched-subunit amino acid transport protein